MISDSQHLEILVMSAKMTNSPFGLHLSFLIHEGKLYFSGGNFTQLMSHSVFIWGQPNAVLSQNSNLASQILGESKNL